MILAANRDGRPLRAALLLSLTAHGIALSLAPPAMRAVRPEPAPPLEVRLLAAPSPAPLAMAPAAPAPPPPLKPRKRLIVAERAATPPPVPITAVTEALDEAPAPLPEPRVADVPAPPELAPEPVPAVAIQPPEPKRVAIGDAELLARYGRSISQALSGYKAYPRIAQMNGWEGAVTMRLRVAQSGQLIGATVLTSSGHEVLDRQAIEMANKAGRLPLPPEGLRDREELAVLVPVIFRLEQ